MIACPSCGADNVEGTRFCVKCGTTLPAAAPAPESWRQSGDLGQQPPQQQSYQQSSYTPPQQPPSQYPTYNPPQGMYQQPAAGGTQPMHPAVPAIVSLFLPGIGLLFVPNKAGLGLGIFGATIVYVIIATILSFVFIGFCLFIVMPLINVAAAIHSWDEAAKASGGQYQPILFK
jgi:zinc-ribbon domain